MAVVGHEGAGWSRWVRVELESFDRADWERANSLVVDRMGYVLGVLATSATTAVSERPAVNPDAAALSAAIRSGS